MGKARRRATRDAHAAALPQYQAIRRDRREARRDLGMGRRANEAAYGGLSDILGDIGHDYRHDYKQLTNHYNRGISGLGGMLNVATGPEANVFGGAFGGVAASGLRGLGQQQSRGIEATRSARTEAAVQQKNNALNLLAAFRDQMEEARHQRQDVAAQESANVRTLTPQYRDQMQAQQEQDRLANWYRHYLMNQGGGGGGQQLTPEQRTQVQQATNFQMADAGASSQARVPLAQAPTVPRQQGNFQTADQGAGQYQAPQSPIPGVAMPPVNPPVEQRTPSRDPFAPPAASGNGLSAPVQPAPTPQGGRGYWYTDPSTGEQMYGGSSVANSPEGEIRYWEKVLASVQGTNPQLEQMIVGHIAELRGLVGAGS